MTDNVLAIDETSRLIASDKVDGTRVYDRSGEKLGHVHNFMVDKRTGRVEYAVLQFGGLFGIGSDFYPLPWEKLAYDSNFGGYVVDLDKTQLENAPRYQAEAPEFDRAYGERVYGHYGLTYAPFI